jgi:hypothetical protein
VVPFVLGLRSGRFLLSAGLFAVFDVLFITAVAQAPQLFEPHFRVAEWPRRARLRLPGFTYLFVYIAASGLDYSPALVL